jgi:hypothetical protein
MQESVDKILGVLEAERATNPDLQHGLDELENAAEAYHKAERYFEDTVPEVFASLRLRRAMQATGTDFRINFARIPVTSVVNRLEISSTACPTDDEATAWIQQQWEGNDLDLEAPNFHLRACEYGDSYAIVWPQPDDEDTEDTASVEAMGELDRGSESTDRIDVGISYNSPLCCRIIYDPEHTRRKAFAIKRWDIPGGAVRVDLYYADRLERYVTKPKTNNPEAGDFYRFHDDDIDDVWPAPNPYGEVPVFHFRNDRPYGTPEHKGFYGTQNALRKLFISHMATVDYQAFQQRYALTAGESDTSEAAAGDEDEFSFGDDATGATKTTGGSSRSQLNAGPGELWWMRGVTQVGAFPEADPDVFMKPAKDYLRFGAQATDTPVRLFDVLTGQQPSAASQKEADGPHTKKVRNRALSFGGTWRGIWECALRMAGFPRLRVVVNWAPPEHVSGLEGWQTVLAQIEAGVPPRVALHEAGYTNEQIVSWFGEEDDDLPAQLEMLKEIALVLQALGAASAFDVIDAVQLRTLIASLLDRATKVETTDEADE